MTRSIHGLMRLAGALVFATVLFVPQGAGAQMGLPGLGPEPPSGPPQSASPQAQKGPTTHAASGGEELEVLPTSEVLLPEEPLKISKNVKKTIGSDAPKDTEVDPNESTKRKWYGLYYEERRGDYRLQTVFPLWMRRQQPNDTASLYGPLYYRRRSEKKDADVIFPAFWNLRNGEERTTVVGPVAWRRAPGKTDNWVAPLVFQGTRNGGGYLHIPPLLTFTKHTETSGFNLVGPAYCSWKGGSTCSMRTAESMDLGLAPLYFYGRTSTSEYEVIPPLLHYYRYNDIGEKSLNIWGPLLWKRDRKRSAFHVLPLFYHLWGQDEDHVTVLPLFHYGRKGTSSLFINPLYISATGDKGEKTFVTWGYARYRGRTHLDMVTPLYWNYRDPDIGLSKHLLFPFWYSLKSPRESSWALFPFGGYFHRYGIRRTTWVTPFFQHSQGIDGWKTNIHPVLYMGRTQTRSHFVLFPVFWDFAAPKGRDTVAFPIFWRFDNGQRVTQLFLNTYYQERKLKNGTDWQFHFFPLFSFGDTPEGHWWRVLLGLAGYTREGSMTKIHAAWIPIELTSASAPVRMK